MLRKDLTVQTVSLPLSTSLGAHQKGNVHLITIIKDLKIMKDKFVCMLYLWGRV